MAFRVTLLITLQLLLFILTMPMINVSGSPEKAREKDKDGLCSSLLLPLGYPCTEYQVTTDDGYILGVQRVGKGHGINSVTLGPPVFLQHGLFQAGDTWFLNTPEESLGFLLADKGFDVWIGNVRGTYWSHDHISLPRNSKEFWDWSWEELAMYDLPAMIGHVYNITNSKVHYVGHSQGTIMAFAAFTDKKVLDMISASAFLSPISFLSHIKSSLVLAITHLDIDKMLQNVGVHEINFRSEWLISLVDWICAYKNVECDNMIASITGPNCCFNSSRIPYYLTYEPHSSSAKNIQHLTQMIKSGKFQRYDYGWAGNLRHYLRLSPPSFSLSDIPETLPMWMAYGGLDALGDTQDFMLTLEQMICKPEIIYLEDYAHLDFVLSVKARYDIYNQLIAFFNLQSSNSRLDL